MLINEVEHPLGMLAFGLISLKVNLIYGLMMLTARTQKGQEREREKERERASEKHLC